MKQYVFVFLVIICNVNLILKDTGAFVHMCINTRQFRTISKLFFAGQQYFFIFKFADNLGSMSFLMFREPKISDEKNKMMFQLVPFPLYDNGIRIRSFYTPNRQHCFVYTTAMLLLLQYLVVVFYQKNQNMKVIFLLTVFVACVWESGFYIVSGASRQRVCYSVKFCYHVMSWQKVLFQFIYGACTKGNIA